MLLYPYIFFVACLYAISSQGNDKIKGEEINPVAKGMITGGVESFLCCPLERIKTMQQQQAKSWIECGRIVYEQRGLRGYWQGATPLMIGSMLKSGLRWGTYDTVKSIFPDDSPYANLISGACAGGVEAMIAVTPSENIRIAMSTTTTGHDVKNDVHARTVPKAMCQMYNQGGISRFFKGMMHD